MKRKKLSIIRSYNLRNVAARRHIADYLQQMQFDIIDLLEEIERLRDKQAERLREMRVKDQLRARWNG
ncbi:MAG: hypothetical protein KDK38_11190 [Leptospiraceae bacterium]|nr:hypothetical protein [Leptospiraceae bacterium]